MKAKDERATKEDASSVAASWEIVTRMAAAAAPAPAAAAAAPPPAAKILCIP